MKSRSLRRMAACDTVLMVCCFALDRRRLLGSLAADLLGIYTGVGLVKIEVYERDILICCCLVQVKVAWRLV
jgi:hypothetical protein